MTQLPKDSEVFAPRTPHIIGRKQFVQAVEDAIADSSGRSYILYFVGPGGIGKTRLLEEVKVIRTNLAGKGQKFRYTDIIDLYHADYHSPGGLRQAIVDGLDPEQLSFIEYRQKREEFEEKRAAGVGGSALEKLRQELDKIFLAEYITLAQQPQTRLVLCFDTLELVQYESDRVQEICKAEDIDTAIKNWLLKYISQLPNTVVLFAGRPRPKIEQEFAQKFTHPARSFTLYPIREFTEKETQEYLDVLRQEHQELNEILTDALNQRIFQITKGNPIYLTLVVDLLLHGETLAQIFPITETDEDLTVDMDLVGQLLVEHLLQLPDPFGPMVYYLIHARKGLDAELLQHLMGTQWSAEEIENNLARMRGFAFVKTRPNTPYLFLHDEVYDLFDRYFKDDPRYGREFKPIADYYRKQLEGMIFIFEHEELVVARLYYELQVDARDGYHKYYAQWDEDAIAAHEVGFDMRLRDEVLRFLERYTTPTSPFYDARIADRIDRNTIDRDCVVRWIQRYRNYGEFQKAYEIAKELRYNNEHPFVNWDQVDDPVYKTNLLITWIWAMLFSGKKEEEIRSIQAEAEALLTGSQKWPEGQEQWRIRAFGHLYNSMGYTHRVARRLQTAVNHYSNAVHYYREADLMANMAATQNNEAYACALLNDFATAEKLIDDALYIRRLLRQKYPLGLSLNTRGLIHLLADQPHRALPKCQEAERIFATLDDPHGIGLANLALGQTYRALGKLWQQDVYAAEQAIKFYEDGQDTVEKSIQIFEERARAPEHLAGAYHELGAIQRDWGLLLKSDNDDLATHRLDQAKKLFEKSITISGEQWPVATADSFEDIADIHIIQHRFSEALEALEQAEALIPVVYRLEIGKGFTEIEEPIEEFWKILGKLERQRALIILAEESHGQKNSTTDRLLLAMGHYAKAVAYLLHFSATSPRDLIKEIYNYLKGLPNLQLQSMREIVEDVQNEYQIALKPLLDDINVTLALNPQLKFA